VKRAFWIVLGALCATGVPPAARAQSPAVPKTPTALSQWIQIPPFAPGSREMKCAERSLDQSWEVVRENLPRVYPHRERPPDPLPPDLAQRREFAGRRHVLGVARGSLVGVDHGEFGGGLWWISTDGSSRERISDRNVRAILRTREQQVIALVGLAHLSLDEGTVLELSLTEGRWQVVRSIDLGTVPVDVSLEPGGALILVSNGLVRYRNGSAVRVHEFEHALDPNSVVASTGTVFVGMRHAVLKLEPEAQGYRESWLVPPWCAAFRASDDPSACECVPAGE
jgi:hypothetical protein